MMWQLHLVCFVGIGAQLTSGAYPDNRYSYSSMADIDWGKRSNWINPAYGFHAGMADADWGWRKRDAGRARRLGMADLDWGWKRKRSEDKRNVGSLARNNFFPVHYQKRPFYYGDVDEDLNENAVEEEGDEGFEQVSPDEFSESKRNLASVMRDERIRRGAGNRVMGGLSSLARNGGVRPRPRH